MPGVLDVKVSLAHEEVLITYRPEQTGPEAIKKVLRQLGFSITEPRKVHAYAQQQAELQREKKRLYLAGAMALAAMFLMLLMWAGIRQPWFKYMMLALALLTVFGPGGYIIRMAYQSLRRGILNQHVLMEAAAFAGLGGGMAGFFYPHFPSRDFFGVSVFVTTYHILSGYVALKVRTKASEAVRRLLSLEPPTATLLRSDGSEEEEEVPVEALQVGQMVRVRPGQQVPVDGVVEEGTSAVDESLVTGESLPVDKAPGAEVIGGSMNLYGSLVVRVSRVGQESFLHQVARQIEEARALKPGIIQLAERVLLYFVPGVLAFSAMALVGWTAGAWMLTGHGHAERAVFAALAVLVMGYPCALGMATPLAIMRGGGMAAQRGILMRSAEAFQVLKDIKTVVFDKTGTLTEGKPQVVQVLPEEGVQEEALLRLAASVEAPSEHPLAKAVLRHARDRGIEPLKVEDFKAMPGKGVEARLQGNLVMAASPDSLTLSREASEKLGRLQEQGRTVIAVASKDRLLGLLAIADTLKPDASESIRELQRLGLGTVMLTGDNERTARAVAQELGIKEVIARVLPSEKAEAIRGLQARGQKVAMVGDGINDAPALMQADVGIALGAGTDVAIESADVVIMGRRLMSILEAYHIGRESYRKTVQNLLIAFGFNGLGVPLATTGLLHPVWAMVAMLGSVSAVLLNSFGRRKVQRPVAQAAQQEMLFRVPDIHCQGCVMAITRSLKEAFGEAVQVEADIKGRTLKVRLPGQAPVERVQAAILRAGFKAEPYAPG
jgi:heavy metal translocating P-type ATPase